MLNTISDKLCSCPPYVSMIAVQAQKEVDGLKKKILDLETKLKALTSDKQQALQVCYVYYNTCYLSTLYCRAISLLHIMSLQNLQ